MRSRREPALTIGILTLLGVASAFISILVPALLREPRSPLFVGSTLGIFPGDVFGALISIYFLTYAGIRSLTKVVALVIASTFAYFLSWLGGTFLGMLVSGALGLQMKSGSGDLEAGMFAPLLIAGISGAFVIVWAVLRLYSMETSWRRLGMRSLVWSLPGGLFGLIGWALGPSLGLAVWSTLASHRLVGITEDVDYAIRSNTANRYSADIVWQIGMSILLGVVLSNTRLLTPWTNVGPHEGRTLKPSNAVLFAVLVVLLAWFVVPDLPDTYKTMLWLRANRAELTAPRSHTPKIDTTPPDVMLILTAVGSYRPEPARAEHSPLDQDYSVRYSHSGDPSVGPCCVGPHVDVLVQDWRKGLARSEFGDVP